MSIFSDVSIEMEMAEKEGVNIKNREAFIAWLKTRSEPTMSLRWAEELTDGEYLEQITERSKKVTRAKRAKRAKKKATKRRGNGIVTITMTYQDWSKICDDLYSIKHDDNLDHFDTTTMLEELTDVLKKGAKVNEEE